jgi:flavin prenyltransferase
MATAELTVAVTGASGSACARGLLAALTAHPDVARVNAVLSTSAVMVAREELGARDASPASVREALAGGSAKVRWFEEQNVGAPIASGSHLSAGMAIVPCSTGTLGAIASGSTRNLIHRAAEVTLKERRRLILGVREAPLSLIHIENMATVTRAGAIVLPITPAFYHLPRTIDDVVTQYVGRVMDLLNLPHTGKRWGS